MPNIASAKKRVRQSEKRRLQNASQRSTMRTMMKRVLAAVVSGDKDASKEAYQKAQPIIDRMANKGLIHKSTAARYKSRLNARVKKLVLG